MHLSRTCVRIWKTRNICTRNQQYFHSQQPPIRAVATALRSWASPSGGESASTGMLTICPQHIAILPGIGSPNQCLDADSPPHHPARNACCLMASPACDLAAQTRQSHARRTHASSDRFAHKTTAVTIYAHCPKAHTTLSLQLLPAQFSLPKLILSTLP